MIIKIDGKDREISELTEYYATDLQIVKRVNEKTRDAMANLKKLFGNKVDQREGTEYALALVAPSCDTALVFENGNNAKIEKLYEEEYYDEELEGRMYKNHIEHRNENGARVDGGELLDFGLREEQIARFKQIDGECQYTKGDIERSDFNQFLAGAFEEGDTVNFALITRFAQILSQISHHEVEMGIAENNVLHNSLKKHDVINGNYKKIFGTTIKEELC